MTGRTLVALVLATGVALFVTLAAIGITFQSEPVSEYGANLLATVLGTTVGAVATYLGTQGRDHPDDGPGRPPQ